jgi:hypothetical protein
MNLDYNEHLLELYERHNKTFKPRRDVFWAFEAVFEGLIYGAAIAGLLCLLAFVLEAF